MFSHIMVGSNDIPRSKCFYDALFLSIAGEAGFEDDEGRLRYIQNGGVFMVQTPINGQPATGANGGTIGFTVTSPELVHAWHDAGVAAGGKSIEDPPGERPSPGVFLYIAYIADPDGNKLCAVYRVPV